MTLLIEWIGSPNKESGRRGFRPEAIVVHIMDGTLVGTDTWFANPGSKVSAHYGVGTNGQIHQYVAESDTAWHAGRRSQPTWRLIKPDPNPNFYTIGIEHEGRADTPWSDAMLASGTQLAAEICNRWSIPVDRDHLIGHREIYGRKTCPGSWVDLDDWVRRARQDVLAPATYNFVSQAGAVVTRSPLNLRQGAPTTVAPVVATAQRGATLSFVGWTSNGLTVNGNAHWYRTDADLYFWAGATTVPVPGVP
jgi:N-acetylmuramoyl-L-alanine amidase